MSRRILEQEKELETLLSAAQEALQDILWDTERLRKHGTFTWTDETVLEHTMKGSRHALTHTIQRQGLEDRDENHLHLAITRLLMAKVNEEI